MSYLLFPHWQEKVVYSQKGPEPQVLEHNDLVRVVIAGLEPGQSIPEHPESFSVYHILQGSGWMTVDGERILISQGATVIMPSGAVRGVKAETQLVFLATRMASAIKEEPVS